MARTLCVGAVAVVLGIGCIDGWDPFGSFNPYRDLPVVKLDGKPHALANTVAPLGTLASGQVLKLKLEGKGIQSALILAEDPPSDQTARLAGGGPANQFFQYRVQTAGRYYVFALLDEDLGVNQGATLTVGPGDSSFQPPRTQTVLIQFEPSFLTNPGLVDPTSFTDAERQQLIDLEPIVRQGVIDRLRTIFTDTPVQILDETDPPPSGPFSVVTLRGQRELATDETIFFDTIVPPLDAYHADCATERVVFGEMLPRGIMVDPGNSSPDDAAVVYAGSFQGRGINCRSAALNSTNNIILGLSHTAAHEIGHLVGLYHVPLVDIMDRSPTQAFQRELVFDRGQILIESRAGSTVLTTVIQDPAFYFTANFAR